jgi:SAM-dependent methyltransferase
MSSSVGGTQIGDEDLRTLVTFTHSPSGVSRRGAARRNGFELDPAMIERARGNAVRSQDGDERWPEFIVGDVASLAFPDRSFDLMVSTLSMHHRADPKPGLAEIGRMLRPGSCARVGFPDRSRAAPRAATGPSRAPTRLFTSRDRRNAMALAMAVQPPPADRARAQLRRTRTHDILDRAPTPAAIGRAAMSGREALDTPSSRPRWRFREWEA